MDLQTLQSHIHIRVLACLEETEAPVISCYLNLESGESGWRNLFESRMRLLRGAQSGQNRIAFSEALAQIRAWLCSSVAGESRGVALFARGGNHPFFLPLQFRAPLPTWIALGPTPNIYHLVELSRLVQFCAVSFPCATLNRSSGGWDTGRTDAARWNVHSVSYWRQCDPPRRDRCARGVPTGDRQCHEICLPRRSVLDRTRDFPRTAEAYGSS